MVEVFKTDMNFIIKGVILKIVEYNDKVKYLSILTEKQGLIKAKIKIDKKYKMSNFAALCVPGYYEFNIFSGRVGNVIDYVETIDSFFNLRFYPEKLALAEYFCELCYIFTVPLQKAKVQLSLLLNSVWRLANGDIFFGLIKSIFELRLLSVSGYMPNIVCCKFCCSYEKENMFFSITRCILICKECLKREGEYKNLVEISKAVLYSMRYIIYNEEKYIFNFRLSKENLKVLSFLVERVMLLILEREPITLRIYKELINGI